MHRLENVHQNLNMSFMTGPYAQQNRSNQITAPNWNSAACMHRSMGPAGPIPVRTSSLQSRAPLVLQPRRLAFASSPDHTISASSKSETHLRRYVPSAGSFMDAVARSIPILEASVPFVRSDCNPIKSRRFIDFGLVDLSRSDPNQVNIVRRNPTGQIGQSG